MRAPLHGLATAFAISTWISAAPALAAEPGPDTLPIHVVSIQTPDADDQAEALTKALRQAVRAIPGWSLGEGDYSLEVLALSLKCPEPPDASCQSRIADQIRADRYVWGILSKGKASNVTGELNFWVRGKGTSKVPVNYSANLTEAEDESLKKIAVDTINRLTGGPPKGEVKVKAGNVAGQVFLDGQPLGALTAGEGTFFVPSGSHQIVVKAPGYSDVAASINVKPNQPTDVVVSPSTAPDTTPVNWKRIGGFASIGAGVAFAAVGVYGSAKVNGLNVDEKSDYNQIRGQYPGDINICNVAAGTEKYDPRPMSEAEAKTVGDTCGSGDTGQLLQFIFYPLAGIAAGAGVYLLATSGSSGPENKTGFIVRPRFDKTGAKLDFGFRF
ncbi:PEGA domain-containing protein [Polyangium aurulentum]|uniref:PEGA domain-containing protein n=1 Tax=Polyangium aurulentum TaxID=2567896 RepID=UPI00146C83C6|nr:PEGA domain-containing protein [Polyangium aurulentum]UQA61220.1 PEGA domain-containing protein [Polyangium aurulentum]